MAPERRRGPAWTAQLACDDVRAAFAVGSANPGFPFDVLALFTSQREALRHADGAAYVFEGLALPVYEDRHELPPWLRPNARGLLEHFSRPRSGALLSSRRQEPR
jgi:hypothetical protein